MSSKTHASPRCCGGLRCSPLTCFPSTAQGANGVLNGLKFDCAPHDTHDPAVPWAPTHRAKAAGASRRN
eukprot:2508589-Pyramimonas_sp.AAC.1